MNNELETLAWAIGDGTYSYPPSGQAYYQDALNNVLRQQLHNTDAQSSMLRVVELVPEPDNPYDERAIVVLAGSDVVGYIQRSDTETIHRLFEFLRCDRLPIHAVIECVSVEQTLYEASILLDIDPMRVQRLLIDGEKPVLVPPAPWESNRRVAILRKGIASRISQIEWMGDSFIEDQVRLRAEIKQAELDTEFERRRVTDEIIRNTEIQHALTKLGQLISEFRATATTSQVIGLGSYRDAEMGLCYLCGGWTDSSDNQGRVSDEDPFVKPGLLFPTDDHVVPQHSVATNQHEFSSTDPDPELVRAWEAVHSEENIKTAHFSCNSRKGMRLVDNLNLPFPLPSTYDESKILKMRVIYKQIRDAKQLCRDLIPQSYMVCGENRVNLERKMLKEKLNSMWSEATDDFVE